MAEQISRDPVVSGGRYSGSLDDESEIRFDERLRIAREIHDEIGPTLATLRLTVGLLEMVDDHASCPTIAERLDATVAAAIDDVRRLTFELRRPPGDAETTAGRDGEVSAAPVDLLDGLRELVAWVTTSGGIPCELRAAADPLEMSVDSAHAIHRAVRELLVNTVRHSGASAASVTLEPRHDRLRVVVEDDGIGLEPSGGASGSGLAIVAERIGELGGTVWSDLRDGGCRFVLVVPAASAETTGVSTRAVR